MYNNQRLLHKILYNHLLHLHHLYRHQGDVDQIQLMVQYQLFQQLHQQVVEVELVVKVQHLGMMAEQAALEVELVEMLDQVQLLEQETHLL